MKSNSLAKDFCFKCSQMGFIFSQLHSQSRFPQMVCVKWVYAVRAYKCNYSESTIALNKGKLPSKLTNRKLRQFSFLLATKQNWESYNRNNQNNIKLSFFIPKFPYLLICHLGMKQTKCTWSGKCRFSLDVKMHLWKSQHPFKLGLTK